jgi:hypothetical protein
MFRTRKRLVILLIASTLAIGAGVAASGIARMATDGADASEARTSELQQPVPESLMPPIAPWSSTHRM